MMKNIIMILMIILSKFINKLYLNTILDILNIISNDLLKTKLKDILDQTFLLGNTFHHYIKIALSFNDSDVTEIMFNRLKQLNNYLFEEYNTLETLEYINKNKLMRAELRWCTFS
jgi:hypothetical protein